MTDVHPTWGILTASSVGYNASCSISNNPVQSWFVSMYRTHYKLCTTLGGGGEAVNIRLSQPNQYEVAMNNLALTLESKAISQSQLAADGLDYSSQANYIRGDRAEVVADYECTTNDASATTAGGTGIEKVIFVRAFRKASGSSNHQTVRQQYSKVQIVPC